MFSPKLKKKTKPKPKPIFKLFSPISLNLFGFDFLSPSVMGGCFPSFQSLESKTGFPATPGLGCPKTLPGLSNHPNPPVDGCGSCVCVCVFVRTRVCTCVCATHSSGAFAFLFFKTLTVF